MARNVAIFVISDLSLAFFPGVQEDQLPRHRGGDQLVPMSALLSEDQVRQGLHRTPPEDVARDGHRHLRAGNHAAGRLALRSRP